VKGIRCGLNRTHAVIVPAIVGAAEDRWVVARIVTKVVTQVLVLGSAVLVAIPHSALAIVGSQALVAIALALWTQTIPRYLVGVNAHDASTKLGYAYDAGKLASGFLVVFFCDQHPAICGCNRSNTSRRWPTPLCG
jgi:hypothetical protein